MEAGMVTIQDVAKAANVSKATVSYVLANSPRISEETASRVRKAMTELGYSVNHAARVLSTSKTMTLGIVIPLMRHGIASISQGSYLSALSDFARSQGYDTMLIVEKHGSHAFQEAIDAKKIDGAIIMEVRQDNDERIELAKKFKLPTVLLGLPHDTEGLDVVDSDFEQAARDLVRHLAQQGKRNLLMVLWPKNRYDLKVNFAVRFRDAAVKEARENEMVIQTEMANSELENPADELRRALKKHPDADSLLIHNDNAVVVAQQVFLEKGMDRNGMEVAVIVPEQMNSIVRVPYASVIIDLDVVAKTVIDVLVSRIKHPDATPMTRLLHHPLQLPLK
jgi:DNA-binding LacI/PurR family transcriptional regulator